MGWLLSEDRLQVAGAVQSSVWWWRQTSCRGTPWGTGRQLEDAVGRTNRACQRAGRRARRQQEPWQRGAGSLWQEVTLDKDSEHLAHSLRMLQSQERLQSSQQPHLPPLWDPPPPGSATAAHSRPSPKFHSRSSCYLLTASLPQSVSLAPEPWPARPSAQSTLSQSLGFVCEDQNARPTCVTPAPPHPWPRANYLCSKQGKDRHPQHH